MTDLGHKKLRTTPEKGRLAAALGLANQACLLAVLAKIGFNASLWDCPLSSFDVALETRKHDLIRIQVKTVSPNGSISFKGGTRGGVDRKYQSGVKEFVQSRETSDVVVGVKSIINNGVDSFEFYILPTIYIEYIKQKSISINKIPVSQNNWDLLNSCKDENYVKEVFDI